MQSGKSIVRGKVLTSAKKAVGMRPEEQGPEEVRAIPEGNHFPVKDLWHLARID